jgi:surface antigen
VGTPAATASTGALCTSYSGCSGAGYPDHGYGAHNGTSYWGMYVGHNCTNYVAYMESLYGMGNPGGLGDAYTWGAVARSKGYVVDGNPAVGAVAWWNSSAGRGSAGHVAYVEGLNGDGTVTISQDVYSAGPYSWEVIARTQPSGYIHFKDKPHYHPLAADYNNDGYMDVGLKDDNNGVFHFKLGPSFTSQVAFTWAPGSNYKAFTGDFDGDGLTDVGLQDSNNGAFYIKHGPTFTDQQVYTWAHGWHYQPFVGDFNGDHTTDIGLRDPSTGSMFIRYGPNFNAQTSFQWAPGEHYQPFVPDYNGDGLADLALRDPSNGLMHVRFGPDYGVQTAYNWAPGAHYQPYAADFNGDRQSELGLRDPNNGILYIQYSPSYNAQGGISWAAG